MRVILAFYSFVGFVSVTAGILELMFIVPVWQIASQLGMVVNLISWLKPDAPFIINIHRHKNWPYEDCYRYLVSVSYVYNGLVDG